MEPRVRYVNLLPESSQNTNLSAPASSATISPELNERTSVIFAPIEALPPPPPPAAAIVIESFELFVVMVTLVPATNVKVSATPSA